MMSSSKIQLWFVIGSLKISGCQTLINLCDRLDQKKFSITVWTLLPDKQNEIEPPPNVKVRSLNARGKWDIRAAITFIYQVQRNSPDILHSFLYFDNILARLAGTFTEDTKVISSVLSVPKSQSKLRSGADRLTIRLSDHIVANSRDGAKFARRRGASDENLSVITNGRDVSRFRTTSEPSNLRESLEIPQKSTVVGTIGRLIESKGHRDLLKAWPRVHEVHPDSHLLIVGEGPELDRLETMASDRGCKDSVTFTGLRTDIPELLSTMDVFAFPSHYEGMPGAVIEAMAAGLPIIATRVTGTNELIDDEETGLLVPPKEPDALKAGLNILLSNSELAGKYGQNAAKVAADQFSLEQMISEYTQLYRKMLAADS